MTKKEKQLLRVVVAILQNLLIADLKDKARYINDRIRKHPENYSDEFIKETGFSKEEIKALLKKKKERNNSPR